MANWWDNDPVVEDPKQKPGLFERMTAPTIQGLQEAGQGLVQAGLGVSDVTGLGGALRKLGLDIPTGPEYTQQAQQQQQAYEKRLGTALPAEVARLVGGGLPLAALPGPGAATGLGRIGQSALMGGTIGAGQFVPGGESRAMQAGLGAAAGGATTGIAESLPGLASAFRTKPRAAEAINAGQQFDVPVMGADVSGRPIVKKISTHLEEVPVIGMEGPRIRQQEKAKQAAERLTEKFGARIPADDLDDAIQQSLQNKARVLKQIAGKKYKEISKLTGDQPVPTNEMNKTALDVVAREVKKAPQYQDPKIIAMGEKYAVPPNASFDELHAIRSDLADDISAYYKGRNQLIGPKEVRNMQAIKKAIDKDMETFTLTQGGGAYKAWKSADKWHKEMIVPFKERDIAAASQMKDTDEIFGKFIKAGKEGKAERFYQALDNKGRDAVRARIVNTAFENSVNPDGTFSPAKFAGSMEKIEAATGKFFRGDDKKTIGGFTNLMRHIERAGQVAENPPTGMRKDILLKIGGISAGMATMPTETMLALGSAGMLRGLLGTQWGARMLNRLSGLEPGTRKFATIIEKNLPNINAYLANKVGPEDDPELSHLLRDPAGISTDRASK